MSYLVRSGYDQFSLLRQREPIEDILKRKDLKPNERQKLELTLHVRDFGVKHLGLKEAKSYRTYVDIERPFVTYIVTVAEKWRLEPKLYWYPLVGKLPYKGYFSKADAEQEAAQFDREKYDVMVRGVTAYSTLGWFEDPLLSSMISGEDHHLVNLIFHESAHATMYFKSQADFNEQLATFVGNTGTELYYTQTEGPTSPTLLKIANENHDEKKFSQFISGELKSLKVWYEELKNKDESLRQTRFQEIQNRFQKEVLPQLKTDAYKGFAKAKLSNASLLYLKTYIYELSEFQKLYDHLHKDMKAFLKFCKTLEHEKDPHHKIQSYLSSAPAASNGP
jgi:predicted aminopeptidase